MVQKELRRVWSFIMDYTEKKALPERHGWLRSGLQERPRRKHTGPELSEKCNCETTRPGACRERGTFP